MIFIGRQRPYIGCLPFTCALEWIKSGFWYVKFDEVFFWFKGSTGLCSYIWIFWHLLEIYCTCCFNKCTVKFVTFIESLCRIVSNRIIGECGFYLMLFFDRMISELSTLAWYYLRFLRNAHLRSICTRHFNFFLETA